MIVNSFALMLCNIYLCIKAGLADSSVSFSRQLSYTTIHKQDTVNILKRTYWEDCTKQCKLAKDCKFVTYITKAKICRMAVYFGKDPWNHDVIEETVPGIVSWLKQGEEMETNCSGHAECHLLYCRLPPQFGSMRRFGNMVTVGAKKSYRCFHTGPGYPVMHTVMCTSGNHWVGLDVVCGYRLANKPYNGKGIMHKPSTVGVDQIATLSTCRKEGAGLIQVTSGDKLDHIVSHLKTYGYFGEYWVDAKKVAFMVWKTSDGVELPLTDQKKTKISHLLQTQLNKEKFDYMLQKISFVDYNLLDMLGVLQLHSAGSLDKYPSLGAYYKRVADRPAIKAYRETAEFKRLKVNYNDYV